MTEIVFSTGQADALQNGTEGKAMKYRVAICDDEQSQTEVISNYLTRFSMKTDIEFKTERFSNGVELLKRYDCERYPFDIIVLDMEMPGRSGLETAEEIRRLPDRNVAIFFITSYPEYMQDSFDVQAATYLIKPVSYEVFEQKLERIITYLGGLSTNITVVSKKCGEMILHLEDIVCIETNKQSGLTITTNNNSLDVKGAICDFERELADKYFVSIHRSCLANMRYIRKFNSDSLEFSTGKTVSVSRRRLYAVKDAFSKYMVMRYKR